MMVNITKIVALLSCVKANSPKDVLKAEIELAMGQQHKLELRPNSALDFNRKEFVDVFLGIAEGMGLNLVDTCVEDSLDFQKQVETSIDAFVGKNVESVADGLQQMGVAIGHTLPKALRVCHASYAEIADLIKGQSAFATPQSFAYHVGKDLWVNGVDIYHQINGAIAAWKAKQYHAFGFSVGSALKDLIVGGKPPSVHPVQIDLSYDGRTEFNVVTSAQTDKKKMPLPSDGVQFSIGLFEGFGVTVAPTCVAEDSELGKLLDAAAESASKGTITGVAIAMEMIAKAYHTVLPEVEQSCGPSVSAAVKEVKDALKNFSSPYEILIRFGHNIEVNEVDIMAELAGFISDFQNGSYKDAGGYIGRALYQVVIGSDKKTKKTFFKQVTDIFV